MSETSVQQTAKAESGGDDMARSLNVSILVLVAAALLIWSSRSPARR